MTQNSRINRFFQFMVILFYIGYGVSCGILYYRQSIQMGGNYYSDLVAHIRSGVYGEGGYSIAYKILGMFYKISGDTRLVAVFLAVVSCLTVFGVYYVLKKLLESQNIAVPPVMVHLYAWACSFAMSIYVPGVYEHFYGGTITGQAWHNSTYLQMRLLGIFLLLLYFTMQKTYLKHIKLSSAAVFMVGLIVINMIKPNFILAFAAYDGCEPVCRFVCCTYALSGEIQADFSLWRLCAAFSGCPAYPKPAALPWRGLREWDRRRYRIFLFTLWESLRKDFTGIGISAFHIVLPL